MDMGSTRRFSFSVVKLNIYRPLRLVNKKMFYKYVYLNSSMSMMLVLWGQECESAPCNPQDVPINREIMIVFKVSAHPGAFLFRFP